MLLGVSVAGLVVVVGAIVAYAVMLFVVHTFTYRTWIFDGVVVMGMLLGVAGWVTGGPNVAAGIAIAVGAAWFPLVRRELRIRGSEQLKIGRGDRFPAIDLVTTQGEPVTERDLVARAPVCSTRAVDPGWSRCVRCLRRRTRRGRTYPTECRRQTHDPVQCACVAP